MAKILLITDNGEVQTSIQEMMSEYEVLFSTDIVTIVDMMKVELPDVVILDTASNIDIKNIYKELKDFQTIRLLLIGDNEVPQEVISDAHQYIAHPINPKILKPTIISGLNAKKSLVKLYNSNKELANSLYQLNVLYNTSSQLSGSLSRNKLVDIVNEGINKSLNPNIACTLSFKDDKTPVLLISSNYKLSDRLVEALKLRAVLNYKNSGIDISEMFTIEDIELEQEIKHTLNEYDFEVLNYHKLLGYITVEDKCYGYSEIFRVKEFTSDDEKCFQTLINQVTSPLKSAILYQEITQKNKELARLERLKSEFISIVSHELKTPLTSIKNSLDIILSGKTGELTEDMTRFLNMAKRNEKKLTRIIKDLLDMSKIEAGKMDYNITLNSIEPVISDVVQNLSQIASQKGLKLQVRIKNDIKPVYADMDRIEQVLTNLISNAIKFSPDNGQIVVSAELTNAEDLEANECFKPDIEKLKGQYVKVCVKDYGIGIEQDDLVNVFDKFEQIENSLSREVGGSGLGLAIAKQLITAQRGAIWCDSVINEGSSFYFVLPTQDLIKD